MAERQHPGHRRGGVQVDALADLVAQHRGRSRPATAHRPGSRRRWPPRAARRATPAGAPARRGGRCRAQGRRAASARTSAAMDMRPSGVMNSTKPTRDPPPVDRHQPRHRMQFGDDVVEQREPHHPLQPGQRGQRQRQRHLRELGQPRRRLHDAGLDLRRRVELVEVARQRPEPGMVVEIGDGHLRIALAHRRHQLRRGQRPTAERVEVGLRPVDRRGEDVAPQPGQPPHGAAEIGLLLGAFARRPARAARRGRPCPTCGWAARRRAPAAAPARRAASRPAWRGPWRGRTTGRRSRHSRPAGGCRWRSVAPRQRRR